MVELFKINNLKPVHLYIIKFVIIALIMFPIHEFGHILVREWFGYETMINIKPFDTYVSSHEEILYEHALISLLS